MTKITSKLWLLCVLVLASCSNEDMAPEATVIPESQKIPMTAQEINGKINSAIETKGSFNWRDASNYMVWSAAVNGNNIVSVGFGMSKNDFARAGSPTNKSIEGDLLQMILQLEGSTLEKVLIQSDQFLNTMDVVIARQETIIALRKSKFIRYVEPADYRYYAVQQSMQRTNDLESTSSGVSSGSGCGYDAVVLSPADYTTVAPNAKAAWTLYQHNIPSAWTYSSGQGITIGIVDTGVSPNQSLLGSSFNNGQSAGRTIQKFGTYVDSVWPWSTGTDGVNDLCGHGTSMASAAAAPRNANGLRSELRITPTL
jgi:serine protease